MYTKNSVICRYISEHKDTWKNDIEAKGIKVTIDDNGLAVFKYGVAADFSDPVVQESRGIIIDLNTLHVICWPFRKFGNTFESYVDVIDYSKAEVQEKIDGSIVKLFFNDKTNAWQWATNGVIDAKDTENFAGINFLRLIQSAVNYNKIKENIKNNTLRHSFTYIFELVHPENQIVIRYATPMLYHTGTRNRETGEELWHDDIGIIKPKVYSLRSYDDCIKAAESLNREGDKVKNEGFVVVDPTRHADGSFSRAKIKSPEYVAMHHMINNGNMTKRDALKVVMTGKRYEIPKSTRVDAILAFYDCQYKLLIYKVEKYIDYVRGLYNEYEHDRKSVAMTIHDDKLKGFGFAAIGNELSAKELVEKVSMKTLEELTRDWEEPDILEKRK